MLILLVFGYMHANAATITGTVTRVIDGDTCIIEVNDAKDEGGNLKPEIRVRLADIDAPEIGQPYGKEAKSALQKMVVGKILTLTYKKKDRYGRIIGTLLINDVSINARMIEQGHAWWYRKYSKNTAYAKLETTARNNHSGLWDLRSITSGFRSQVSSLPPRPTF